MIKILFFLEKFGNGGAEIVLRDLVNHLDHTLFDITVQSVWPYNEGKLLESGVKYKTVYPERNKITERLYRLEAALGLTYPLHIKDKYDIECAFLESGPTKILSSSTNKKAKKIAWVHCDLRWTTNDIISFEKKTSPWYEKYDRIVCVSQNVKEAFDQLFHNRFRTDVVHNVVDDQSIRQKASCSVPGIEKRRLTMLAVGRLYPQKNYPRLLRAHERLLLEGIEHDLWILGEGSDRPKLEQFITDHNLSDSVTLFGFQDNPFPYMRAADLIVCSSNFEGYSTAITESVILGKPIVTTDCTGMREILGNCDYGLITEKTDEAFYEGLKTMLTNRDLRNVYAQKAAEHGMQFSMKKLVADTQEYLLEVFNE